MNPVLLAFLLLLTACTGDAFSELQIASMRGQNDRVQLLLSRGADIDQPNKHGRTALMLAADKGQTETVALLLKHNAFKDGKDIDGMTALMLAAANGHAETMKVLLDAGSDPNVTNNYDATALTNAVFFGHQQATAVLLEQKEALSRETSENALLIASGLGYKEIAGMLLDYGVDVNSRGKEERTPLMAALQFKHYDTANFLLDKGADWMLRDADGVSSLNRIQEVNQQSLLNKISKLEKKRS